MFQSWGARYHTALPSSSCQSLSSVSTKTTIDFERFMFLSHDDDYRLGTFTTAKGVLYSWASR